MLLVLVVGEIDDLEVLPAYLGVGSAAACFLLGALDQLVDAALVVVDHVIKQLPQLLGRLFPPNLLPPLDRADGHPHLVGEVDLADADALAHRLEVGLVAPDVDHAHCPHAPLRICGPASATCRVRNPRLSVRRCDDDRRTAGRRTRATGRKDAVGKRAAVSAPVRAGREANGGCAEGARKTRGKRATGRQSDGADAPTRLSGGIVPQNGGSC